MPLKLKVFLFDNRLQVGVVILKKSGRRVFELYTSGAARQTVDHIFFKCILSHFVWQIFRKTSTSVCLFML